MKRLISYNQTPQVTGLEYSELRDLEKHPEKAEYYEHLAEIRKRNDRKEKLNDEIYAELEARKAKSSKR